MDNKSTLSDLACFGGLPAFPEKLYVGRPNLCNREKYHRLVDQIFDNHWLTNDGPCLQEFEQRLCEYLGVRNCVSVCNATVGLQMVYRAFHQNQQSRSHALLPSFTFVATAHAWTWEFGEPCFCDVQESNHLLSPTAVQQQLGSSPAMIIGVHTWGQPCNIGELTALAKSYKIPLVFDAAHAFANRWKNRKIGGWGDAEIFSFHATKFFNTIEGGAISTDNDALADELRGMRNFGFAGCDNVTRLGINGKMQEMSAAMGLALFDEIDSLWEMTHKNYETYLRAFEGIRYLELMHFDHPENMNCQYIVGILSEDAPMYARDLLVKILWEENILARRYFFPGCHRSMPYASWNRKWDLPVTEKLCQRVIVFPTGRAVDSDKIQKLANLVRFIMEHLEDIHQKSRDSRV